MTTLRNRVGAFVKGDRGSATIETVIWIPIFVYVMALVINVSMVVFEKNQAYRVVQNANRILATGYMQTEDQVEDYIREQLVNIAPDANIETSIENGIVTSKVYYQISDLILPHAVQELANLWVDISSQHYVEY